MQERKIIIPSAYELAVIHLEAYARRQVNEAYHQYGKCGCPTCRREVQRTFNWHFYDKKGNYVYQENPNGGIKQLPK